MCIEKKPKIKKNNKKKEKKNLMLLDEKTQQYLTNIFAKSMLKRTSPTRQDRDAWAEGETKKKGLSLIIIATNAI